MKVTLNFGALKRVLKKLHQEFGDAVDGGEVIHEIVTTGGKKLHEKIVDNTPSRTGKLKSKWELGEHVKRGFNHAISVVNEEEYAEYVEHGHYQKVGQYVPEIGKRLVNSWIEGKHFVEKSTMEMEEELPDHIEGILNKKISEVFND